MSSSALQALGHVLLFPTFGPLELLLSLLTTTQDELIFHFKDEKQSDET